MRSRSAWTGALLGAGSLAGGLLFRRRAIRRRERADLYFADGQMLSLAGSAAAEPLLRHAREILDAARG